MDNVHHLPPGMALPPDVMPQPSQDVIEEQRRFAAVQLAIQSLHGDGGYDNAKLTDRAQAIEQYVAGEDADDADD